jgi:AcrR family transcriptional regulator
MDRVTAPKRTGPGRPRSLDSEAAILDATRDLLAAEGYGAFTVDRLAARARVSKSTIYRRWPSKEHLVIAAFDSLPPLQAPDHGDAAAELADLVLQFVAIMRGSPLGDVLLPLVAERARNPDLSAALDPWIQRRRGPMKQVIARAVQRGQLPAGTDPDMAEDALMGAVLLRLYFAPGDLGPAAVQALVGLVLRGLGGRAEAR